MKFRLRTLGFMEIFAKQQSSGKILHEIQRSQTKFHKLNIYI